VVPVGIWLRQLARARADCAGSAKCRIVLAESLRAFLPQLRGTGELYPCEIVERLCDVLKTGDVVTVDLDQATVTVQATARFSTSNPLARCVRSWTREACSTSPETAG